MTCLTLPRFGSEFPDHVSGSVLFDGNRHITLFDEFIPDTGVILAHAVLHSGKIQPTKGATADREAGHCPYFFFWPLRCACARSRATTASR